MLLPADVRRNAARSLAVVLGAALLSVAPPGPAPLGYDPEAWLIWGRELGAGTLDVTAGPAVKPLPVVANAALVAVAGDEAGRAAWATLALSGLVISGVLAARLARAAGARGIWVAAASLCVVLTPTVVSGGLTGAAEPVALAGMLGAALALGGGRPRIAAAALAAVALLRPEVLLALTLLLGCCAVHARTRRGRLRWATAAVAVPAGVAGIWAVLQLLGAGTVGGGIDAATALRPGQPGLADHPVLAAIVAAAVCLVPAAVAIAAGVGAAGASEPEARRDGSAGFVWAALLIGASWLLLVVVMAAAGFSGEPRYLAPGAVMVNVAAVVWASGRRARLDARARVALVAGLAASVVICGDAWRAARDVSASQGELTALAERVKSRSEGCSSVAVPRFMRPAVAWRLGRPMSSIRAPSVDGACVLTAADAAPPSPEHRVIAEVGRWRWWRAGAGEHVHPER